MKFSCDSCGRKYRIEDEKVRGKTLRMDCRKCGKKILIDGKNLTATTSDRPPTARPPATNSPLSKGFYEQVSGPRPDAGGGLGAREPKHWHVEINNVAVGPIGRSEVARKIETGAVKSSSLCWREGFDDWRPLHTVSELAALLQPAKPPAPPVRIRNSTPPPPPPRSTGNRAAGPRPAAIGGRAGASAAVAMAPSPVSSHPERDSQPEPRPFSSVPAPTPAPIASLPPLVSHPPASSPGFAPDPTMDLDMAGDGQTMVDAPAPMAGPTTLTSEPPFAQKKAGVPLMLYVAGGAGALFLMAIGIFIGVRFLGSPTPEPVPAAPKEAEVATEEPKSPDIEIPLDETGGSEEVVDEPTDETASKNAGAKRNVRTTTPKKTNDEPELTEEEKRRLAQMGGGSINLKSGSSGTSSSSGGGGRQLTESQIRGVVTKNYRNIQRCYERAIRGMGKVPAFRLDAKVKISGAGRVATINVSGNDVGGLKSCISGAVRTWSFPGTGATTETSIPFVFREVG